MIIFFSKSSNFHYYFHVTYFAAPFASSDDNST